MALTACTTTAESIASPCITLKLECTGAENILIVGSVDAHKDLLNTALVASQKFEVTFKTPASKIVIVPGGSISAEQNAAFKAAGYPASLPWISAADKAKLRESSIRKQVEAQTKNLPEAVRAAAMAQALGAVKGGAKNDQAQFVQDGAFAHELGHLWFIQAFKPVGATPEKGHAYGGWAPDWLDETAAVLMENATLNEKRRESFARLAFEETIPLQTFLTMEHPAVKAASGMINSLPSEKMQSELSGSRAIVLSGKEAEEFLKNSGGNRTADFYAQTQVFSDFLLSFTGDTGLYVSLTQALLEGASFGSWLMSAGADWGLPTSMAALESEWQAWVEELD